MHKDVTDRRSASADCLFGLGLIHGLRQERMALRCEPGLEAGSAVAIVTSPVLSAVQVTAAAPGMSILDLEQLEVLFPIRTFLRERSRAIANFNPLNRAVIELPRLFHVSRVFVTGNGAST